MLTFNRLIVKKDKEYKIIEEVLNPDIYALKLYSVNGEFARLYRNNLTVYKDANINKVINIMDYEGCSYINARNICSKEFLESNFFKNNQAEIILIMASIIKEKRKHKPKDKILDLNDKSCYKVLNSQKFLTSDFAKAHYAEIYNTLDKIISERESKQTTKTKSYKKK